MRAISSRLQALEKALLSRRQPPRFSGIVVELHDEAGRVDEIEEYDLNFNLKRRYVPGEQLERTH